MSKFSEKKFLHITVYELPFISAISTELCFLPNMKKKSSITYLAITTCLLQQQKYKKLSSNKRNNSQVLKDFHMKKNLQKKFKTLLTLLHPIFYSI